jgi:hypothetical protein
MIITFLYQINGIRYYGKFIGTLEETYEEGLDIELLKMIHPKLLEYYHLENPSDITIGILSSLRGGNDYFSKNEKNVFDMLYLNSLQSKEVFIHGIQICKN